MPPSPVKTYPILTPLSWLYGVGVVFRNRLFDLGWLHSRQFDLPVISVGNITVGGTGKTPHVEYLIRLLREQYRVAILSRGYKRQTKGFLVAEPGCTASDIGDEPMQMASKFDGITVAVDADRCNGIRQLIKYKRCDVILLDDAFQHRYVKPGLSLLLTDYHRLLSRDRLLPAGKLREPASGKQRADIVIVTKCPPSLTKEEAEAIKAELQLENRQQLYFSCIEYAGLQPFLGGETKALDEVTPQHHLLLLTGIASPEPIEQQLSLHSPNITSIRFGDHHAFTADEMQRVAQCFDSLPTPKMLITTEKDAARLTGEASLPPALLPNSYTLPIRMRILFDRTDFFNQQITTYVRENSSNGILAESKDDHPAQDSHRVGHRPGTIGC